MGWLDEIEESGGIRGRMEVKCEVVSGGGRMEGFEVVSGRGRMVVFVVVSGGVV